MYVVSLIYVVHSMHASSLLIVAFMYFCCNDIRVYSLLRLFCTTVFLHYYNNVFMFLILVLYCTLYYKLTVIVGKFLLYE